MEDSLDFFADGDVEGALNNWSELGSLAEREWRSEAAFQYELDRILEAHDPEMLRAYAEVFENRFGNRHECSALPGSLGD